MPEKRNNETAALRAYLCYQTIKLCCVAHANWAAIERVESTHYTVSHNVWIVTRFHSNEISLFWTSLYIWGLSNTHLVRTSCNWQFSRLLHNEKAARERDTRRQFRELKKTETKQFMEIIWNFTLLAEPEWWWWYVGERQRGSSSVVRRGVFWCARWMVLWRIYDNDELCLR